MTNLCFRCKSQPRAAHSIYCVGCCAVELAEFHRLCNWLADGMIALCRASGDEAAAARIERGKRRGLRTED